MAERARQDVITDVAMFGLKSAGATTVEGEIPDRLTVGPAGFEAYGVRDRDFMLAYGNPDNAAFVTQRGWGPGNRKVETPQDRQLATVGVDVHPDHVRFTAPGLGTLYLPTEIIDGEPWKVDIFGKTFQGVDQGEEAANFFNRFLDGGGNNARNIRLVRADRFMLRLLPKRYCHDDASNLVSGADGMPFLLASEASLDALHNANGLPLGAVAMGRFRANVVISGEELGPWAEDSIDYAQIGDMGAYAVKACSRCPIPNTNQENGQYDGASSKILGSRAGEIFTGEKGVFFGQNLNHQYDEGEVSTVGVGDPVVVVEWAPKTNVRLRNEGKV